MDGIIAFIEAWINSGIKFLGYSIPAILVYGVWRANKDIHDEGVLGWWIIVLVTFWGFGVFGSVFYVGDQFGAIAGWLNFAFWTVISLFIGLKKVAPRGDKTEED